MAQPTSAEVRAELRRRFGEDFLDWAELWSVDQKKVLTSELPFLFVFGGNGAGKTTIGGYWSAMQLHQFNPITSKFWKRPQTVTGYCVGNTLEKVKGVMQPALKRWLPPAAIEREDRQQNIWYLRDGARVLWKTGSQDVETFGGDECDFIWIDEELSSVAHWEECLARTSRRLGKILTTLTPALGTLWLHAWVFSPDKYPMEEKELVRIPMDANPYYWSCDNCMKPRLWHEQKRPGCCSEFTNAGGQKKLERARRQFIPGSIVYKIRYEGHYLLMNGNAVIDQAVREKHEKLYRKDPVCGYLTKDLTFVHMDDPHEARAWLRVEQADGKMLTPKPGSTYVIGVDVGGGNPMGDYHAAVVFDYETGDQVALAHTRSCDPRDFAILVDQLGRWYNEAFVVPEVNNHGYAFVLKLTELGYSNIYRRQRVDGIATPSLPRLGFFTDVKSKPAAVDLMSDYFANRWKVRDPIILAEAFHYTWLKENRQGTHGIGNSNPDGHDDTMSACFTAAFGLRALGWSTGSFEERVETGRRANVGEILLADATGNPVMESDLIDAVEGQNQALVEDVLSGEDDGGTGIL